MARRIGPCALALLALIAECTGGAGSAYYGVEIGALSSLHHGVRGRVFAVDSRTLYLHDFHYDGEGPAAYFYVGNGKTPGGGAGAVRLRDERGGTGPLRRYRGEGLTLALPEGRTLKDIKWLSVWCDDFSVNFGSVSVPRALEAPRSVRAGALRGIHGVASAAVVVVDAQTLLVPNFFYDGEAPDAKFWVGRGASPSPQGIRIPDEHGSEAPLRKYDNKTIVLTLPGELTVFDIGHFGVWCEAFTVDFGHVVLPPALLQHVPPSLKMLGVSPQSRNKALAPAPAAASPRASPPRHPPARLKATTYRPPLRLRPGAAPGDVNPAPAPHTSLHRRADTFTPPKQQLLNQQSTDEKEAQSEEKQSLKDEQKANVQKEAITELPIVQTQQAHNSQKTHQQQTHQQTHIHNQQTDPQQYYQQQQSQEIYQEHYQEPEYLQPQQHLYPYIPTPGFRSPFYQPQIFDQKAFELLNRQYEPQPVLYHPQTAQYQQQPVHFHPQQFQPHPEQYRLVPYKYE